MSLREIIDGSRDCFLWEPYERTSAMRGWLASLKYSLVFWLLMPTVLLLPVMPVISVALAWRVKRVLQPHLMRRRLNRSLDDSRPPILFLRRFVADADQFAELSHPERPRQVSLFSAGWSPEEVVCNALGRLGPVIALGNPGDLLPATGAIRLYVKPEHWQSVVDQLLGMAQLIVVRAGSGSGLRWEIGKIIEREALEKTVLMLVDEYGFPFGMGDYERFRDSLADSGLALPARGWNSWFVHFGASPSSDIGVILGKKPWRGSRELKEKTAELLAIVTQSPPPMYGPVILLPWSEDEGLSYGTAEQPRLRNVVMMAISAVAILLLGVAIGLRFG